MRREFLDRSRVTAHEWARETFGTAQLGDARRTARLVSMATDAAAHPAGKVTQVFGTDAGRQGAYDFLESERTGWEPIAASIRRSAATMAVGLPFVFVPVDGSTLNIADLGHSKGFGPVSNYSSPARGLRVMDAIGIAPDGTPLQICGLHMWNRASKRAPTHHHQRTLDQKETRYWHMVIDQVLEDFSQYAPQTKVWFVMDREADCCTTLSKLAGLDHWFTVRAARNRRVLARNRPTRLRALLQRQPIVAEYELQIPAGSNREARTARMVTRCARVTLACRDKATSRRFELQVNVIWTRELGTVPRGHQPLEWTLYTNHSIDTLHDIDLVIFGYSCRWRIEDYHRSWKSGCCQVEDTLLETPEAVMKWATILGAVAMRVERIKHLSREQPDLPANVEFSDDEIRAAKLLKRMFKKKTEKIRQGMPTIAQLTWWIAELGGYTGKSSGGPPGTTTITRGLKRVCDAAEVLAFVEPRRRNSPARAKRSARPPK